MSVIFSRTGTPFPGKRSQALDAAKAYVDALNARYGTSAEVHVRFGGPAGQVIMVSRHKNVQELEDLKRKVILDTAAGHLPPGAPDVFEKIDDAVWLVKSK